MRCGEISDMTGNAHPWMKEPHYLRKKFTNSAFHQLEAVDTRTEAMVTSIVVEHLHLVCTSFSVVQTRNYYLNDVVKNDVLENGET